MASVILAGTTSTTALNLTGDTSGELQLKTNNGSTTALTLTTGGNINIPTTGARITGDFSNATFANRVAFQTSTTNSATTVYAIPNGTSQTVGFIANNNSSVTDGSEIRVLINDTTARVTSSFRGTGSTLPLAFDVGSERLRIDTSGNVGIGTSSPSATLDVRNTSNEQIRFGYTGTPNYCSLGRNSGTGNFNIFVNSAEPLLFGTNNTERMRIDSSGRVGIGISTTNQQLAIAGTANATYSSASGMVVNLLSSSTSVVVPIGFSWSGSIANTSPYWGMGFIPTNFGSGLGDLGFYTSAAERMRITSGGNVGIGTTNPSYKFHVADGYGFFSGANYGVLLGESNCLIVGDSGTTNAANMIFYTANTEKMRLTTGGNLLVGKTSTSFSTAGTVIYPSSGMDVVRSGGTALSVNRTTNDGTIVDFYQAGTLAGSIGTNGGSPTRLFIVGGDTGLDFEASTDAIRPCSGAGGGRDNAIDLGRSDVRFRTAYITNGVVTGSDLNDKQDIEELTDAETRVAIACKGLLRKWRWKDSVVKKGDDARIHFGIIAQDLKAAFEAEGLDAGRYSMFVWNEWWESTETYKDSNGVEKIRSNTYQKQEDAPEGAVRKERMGIRYNELLAFMIAAI